MRWMPCLGQMASTDSPQHDPREGKKSPEALQCLCRSCSLDMCQKKLALEGLDTAAHEAMPNTHDSLDT